MMDRFSFPFVSHFHLTKEPVTAVACPIIRGRVNQLRRSFLAKIFPLLKLPKRKKKRKKPLSKAAHTHTRASEHAHT